ncbi:MAG: hypothetical protein J1E41_05535 [Ruminococcus sp.]|nr:hypothetical protein [Ruminococcus sp.]
MLNNKINNYQFLSSVLLSTLSFPLFINNIPSVYLFIGAAAALLINILIFTIYKGQAISFLKPVAAVFLTIYCVVVVSKFIDYMYNALSYGPLWLMLIILLLFAFFCTVKGMESAARASVIISVFIIAGIIYMMACTFSNIDFTIYLNLPSSFLSVIILLVPSAFYVLFYKSIIPDKKYNSLIFSLILFVIYIFFSLISSGIISPYPIQKLPTISQIGIFKGSDCILLAILTLSALYSVSLTTVGLFKSFKHKYITNALYIVIILILSLITVYYPLLDIAEWIILPLSTAVVILLIIVFSLFRRKKMYKNS